MSLINVCNISDMSFSEKLEVNLISAFDWGFVNRGGYINVNVNQTGAYVDNRSVLEKVNDLSSTGVLYCGPENWVYESDVSSMPAPLVPLVYVNNVLDVSGAINYRDGIVKPSVFVPSTGVVKARFSYKWVTFTSARKSNSRRQIQYRQTRTDLNKVDVGIPSEIKVPLPTVTIDVPSVTKSKQYDIMRYGSRLYFHDVNMYIIGESASDVVKICDIICSQAGDVINSFDPKLVVQADDFPLKFDGTVNSGKNHDQLAEDYPWAPIKILSAESMWSGYLNEHIYQAIVRIKTELRLCLGCT